jgi:hypothetical protein
MLRASTTAQTAQALIQRAKARMPEAAFEEFLSLQQDLVVGYHEADLVCIEPAMERMAAVLTTAGIAHQVTPANALRVALCASNLRCPCIRSSPVSSRRSTSRRGASLKSGGASTAEWRRTFSSS